jgi:N6-adenosine-specific RNA methylase IME4
VDAPPTVKPLSKRRLADHIAKLESQQGKMPPFIDPSTGELVDPSNNNKAARPAVHGNDELRSAAVDASLIRYDAACRALAEAKAVDELTPIIDAAKAMQACAKVAKNHQLEADAVALRMRATRRLGELIEAQKQTVGLSKGGRPTKTGSSANPVLPTLKMQGIDKALAHQARVLGPTAMSETAFERKVEEAQASSSRVVRRAVREVEIAQERDERRTRTATGGTVADLHELIASGYRAGCLLVDPPWRFKNYSGECAVADQYETMAVADIAALPVPAADDAILFLWATWPTLPDALAVIDAWDFTYKTAGFLWVKTLADGSLYTGRGYHTRANSEPVLLAKRGNPRRLNMDVRQIVMAPVGQHSVKPEEVARRIERLYPGPYLELFARRERPGWTCWGDELLKQAAE